MWFTGVLFCMYTLSFIGMSTVMMYCTDIVQLGLGSGCVRVVPCSDEGPGGVGGASGACMDTTALSRMMAEDAAAHKRPFLVLANTGMCTIHAHRRRKRCDGSRVISMWLS